MRKQAALARTPSLQEKHSAARHSATVRLRYVGSTALTVQGPATGRLYRFDRSGAIVRIFASDAAAMLQLPQLVQVQP